MTNFIKKLPIALSGIMLSLASFGNLMAHYSLLAKKLCGTLSLILFILLTLKILIFYDDIKKDLNNPLIASVSPNYAMGLMVLSTYLKDIYFNFAFYLWIIALLIHIGLLIFYTNTVLLTFDIKKLFPSTLVVYVGIGVVAITAPSFNLYTLGQYFFWFTFSSFIILFPILIYRVFVVRELPKDALPTLAIFAAPASVNLSAYLNTFNDKNIYIIAFLGTLSLIIYILVLTSFTQLLKSRFYPSFSSFVFPMVISAIAMKKFDLFLISLDKEFYILKYVVIFQEIFAFFIIMYVSLKYIVFLKTK